MADAVGQVPVAVLRNRGVPVKLHVLEHDPETSRWRRVYSEAGEPTYEDHYVQMTNAVLADITDPINGWGSLDAWNRALRTDPHDSLQHTLALCLDWWKVMPDGKEEPDARRAGVAMIDAEVESYSAALGAAFMLANGVRPERVGEVLAAGITSAAELRDRMMDRLADQAERVSKETNERMRKALEEVESGGTIPTSPDASTATSSVSGSDSGSDTGPEASTSSGG